MRFHITIYPVYLVLFLNLKGADSTLLSRQPRSYKNDNLVVELAHPVGKIRGHIIESQKGNAVYAFQDVPYAQPPVGENRFKPPQTLDGWDGVLETTSNKKVCPQISTMYADSLRNTNIGDVSGDEDCLVLNVYTPVKPGTNVSLPVYFWIHGGGFLQGSGSISIYNPKYFMDYEIVVVVINYRIGALGFLTTNDESVPGNLGLKDQHLALKWTIDNIHLFGGDPNQVTVGGESSGGTSSGYHLLSRLNEGLIKGVIQQSGSSIQISGYQVNYTDNAFQFGRLLNPSFNSNKSSDLLKVLQAATLSEIMGVQSQMPSPERVGFLSGGLWKPVIENYNSLDAFVTGPMGQDFFEGRFNKIPTLLGFNSEESLLFLLVTAESEYNKSAQLFDENPALMISSKLNVPKENRETAGREVKKIYTDVEFLKNKTAFVRYSSDTSFTRPVIRQAELTSKFIPVYLYKFSYDLGVSNVPPGAEHVGHSEDLMYLWDTPLYPVPLNETIRTMLLKLWTNFIKTQDPTPVEDTDLQFISWPRVASDVLQYLNIDKILNIETNPRQYKEVKRVLDKYVEEPYIIY